MDLLRIATITLLLVVSFQTPISAVAISSPDEEDDYPNNCTSSSTANTTGNRYPKQDQYQVVVTERNAVGNHGASLISKVNGSSEFQYNFNAAWFPTRNKQDNLLADGLVVRVVDWERHPEWANAGAMAMVSAKLMDQQQLTAETVTEDSIRWAGAPSAPPNTTLNEIWGAVDPRITYRPDNQLYYLTWDNCTKNCWPQRITYLSTCLDPLDPLANWTFHGAVFPFPYTSGAALLFRDHTNNLDVKNNNNNTLSPQPHLAFICNSNTAGTIFVAESWDGLDWSIPQETDRQILLQGRPGCWDAAGIAAGPQPERLLSTGDYLLIYNIDTGWPYHPNPLGRCAIGWAILDGTDPTRIVARSEQPLLVASLPWETCQYSGKGPNCQVPQVVFATGLKPLTTSSSSQHNNNKRSVHHKEQQQDEFYLIYGGADTVVGVAKIQVTFQADDDDDAAAASSGEGYTVQ